MHQNPRVLLTISSNLNPGGILEIQDVYFDVQSSDGTLAEDSALRMWSKYILEASRNLGAPLDSVLGVKSLLIQAGFQNVQQTVQLWPMTWWPKDPRHKKIGGSLAGFAPFLFPSPTDVQLQACGLITTCRATFWESAWRFSLAASDGRWRSSKSSSSRSGRT